MIMNNIDARKLIEIHKELMLLSSALLAPWHEQRDILMYNKTFRRSMGLVWFVPLAAVNSDRRNRRFKRYEWMQVGYPLDFNPRMRIFGGAYY